MISQRKENKSFLFYVDSDESLDSELIKSTTMGVLMACPHDLFELYCSGPQIKQLKLFIYDDYIKHLILYVRTVSSGIFPVGKFSQSGIFAVKYDREIYISARNFAP